MDTCVVCGGVEFYTESGFYYCQQCETQQENRQEAVVEYAADASTYVTRKKIERPRRVATDVKDASLGWTSWETFNIILHGWTNELIMLGARPNIKITILQLWATYLGKLEVAFRSFNYKSLPKLPIAYRKKDSEIVYANVKSGVKRKIKRRGSNPSSDGESTHASDISFGRLLSQRKRKLVDVEYQKYLDSSGSETEGASSANQSLASIKSDVVTVKKKRGPSLQFNRLARAQNKQAEMKTKKLPVRERVAARNLKLTRHKASVEHLSLPDLLAVIILALRIDDEKIHISDIIRFQYEGHMSTRKLDHFFPHDEPIPKDFKFAFSGYSYEALHNTAGELALFLNVSQIPEPNIVDLIRRYCTDLQLPNSIALYAERMIAMSPPKLTLGKWRKGLPHYEAKAMSVILIVMKILFGLDGVSEYEISRVVSKINSMAEENDALDSKLFNFLEWQRYIECRRSVIISQHSATRLRLESESPCQNYSEYLRYLSKFITPEENMDPTRSKVIKQLGVAVDQNMENLAENLPEMEKGRVFEPSLTPMHSYLQELLKDNEMDLPSLLKQNFSSMKIGYMTNTETFKELAKECGINLKIIDSSANFLERIIPTTGSELLNSDIKQQSKSTPVIIVNPRKHKKCDDPSSYLHIKNTGKIFIDEKKRTLYIKNIENSNQTRKNVVNDFDDFAFEQVRSNGKLNILEFDDDSDSDDDVNKSQVFNDENLLLSNFERESLKSGIKSHWHSEKMIITSQCRRKNSSPLNDGGEGSSKCNCVMCMKYVTRVRRKTSLSNGNEDEEVKICQKDDVTIIEDEDDDLTIVNEITNSTSDFDKDEILILSEKINSTERQTETTYRPYKDYWLHRKSTKDNSVETLHRWHLLERDLPINFRWLLNECANMIELDTSVLYNKLAFMESYYADCLVQNYNHERAEKFYDALDHRDSRQTRTIAQKWINEYKKNM